MSDAKKESTDGEDYFHTHSRELTLFWQDSFVRASYFLFLTVEGGSEFPMPNL